MFKSLSNFMKTLVYNGVFALMLLTLVMSPFVSPVASAQTALNPTILNQYFGDGVTTTFTPGTVPAGSFLKATVGGVPVEYSWASSTTVTMATAPASKAILQFSAVQDVGTVYKMMASEVILNPQAPAAAASATAAADVQSVTGAVGGAQSATTGNGAAGGRALVVGGVGGAGGSSSGTGGTGGALTYTGGAGGGTITGGTGGAASFVGGAGGAGSSAGGTGGALTLGSGAAGSGGTGTVGAVAIKSGATTVFSTSTAGATSVISSGTAQDVTLTPSTSGKIVFTGGTDPTKKIAFDASSNTTAITQTFNTAATSARTVTVPDATFTISGLKEYECGTSAACSPTTVSTSDWIFSGSCALSSASPSTCSVSALSPAYTSSATYWCTATPEGTAAATAAAGIAINKTSGSAFTLTGPNTVTTVIDWQCRGH